MNRNRLVVMIVGLVVVVGGAAGGWFALQNFREASQATVDAMPAGVLLYGSVDVVNLLEPGNLRQLNESFEPAFDSAEIDSGSQEDVAQRFDEVLEPLGVTFADDIQSWIGRSVGAGVLAFDYVDGEPVFDEYVIAAEVRSRSEADAFIEKIGASTLATSGTFERVDFVQVDDVANGFVLGRSGSLMIVASSESAFGQAVTAQSGESLATDTGFVETIARLPEVRTVTLFMAKSAMERVLQLAERNAEDRAETSTLPAMGSVEQLRSSIEESGWLTMDGAAASIALADSGVQIDFGLEYNENLISADLQKALTTFENYSGSQADVLPTNTLFYIGTVGLGHSWERFLRAFAGESNPEDIEDSIMLAEQTLGFSVQNDLMPQLVGDFGIAVVEDAESIVAQFSDAQIGLMIVNGVADSAEMQTLATQMSAALINNGLAVEETDWLFTVDFLGTTAAHYGVIDDNFMIATSLESLEVGGERLSSAESYTTALQAMPDDMEPVLFVDAQRVLAILPESVDTTEVERWLGSVQSLMMATAMDESGGRSRLMISLDQ